jgi:hypothetical protein
VSERLKILAEIITHFILYQEEIILFPMISDAVSFLSLRGAQRRGNLINERSNIKMQNDKSKVKSKGRHSEPVLSQAK